jgi:hypothetical protein
MKLDSGDALPDLYKIIELFWNNRRLLNAQEGLATHRAFPATFQGQSIQWSSLAGFFSRPVIQARQAFS